jgi:hypothetical protein
MQLLPERPAEHEKTIGTRRSLQLASGEFNERANVRNGWKADITNGAYFAEGWAATRHYEARMDMFDIFIENLVFYLYDPLKKRFGAFIAVIILILLLVGVVTSAIYAIKWQLGSASTQEPNSQWWKADVP